ncbi:MAG: Ig-like domain-containing protein [Lysobacterales bacterium]
MSGDTTLPTASASVTGSSGTITLNATASDNVGVTSVEFLIDNVSRGTDSTSPYSLAFNSTTLSNGTHSLVVKAADAAGNIGTSTAVSFAVNNTVPNTAYRPPRPASPAAAARSP